MNILLVTAGVFAQLADRLGIALVIVSRVRPLNRSKNERIPGPLLDGIYSYIDSPES